MLIKNVEKCDIEGLLVIEPAVFEDDRGYFMETFNERDLEKVGIKTHFVQDNQSKSTKNVLRGLHFQTIHPQAKLVRVIKGEVYDVAVDLRKDSPTFGKWKGVLLTEKNKKMFYIPKGFAHGFAVISDEAVFSYKCDDYWCKEGERGIIWNDPDININWGDYINLKKVILSEKDQKHPTLKEWVSDNSPKEVCVLLSTYNGEKFLREQLDSVLSQEGVKVKLFVRDDGSKDRTVEILREYEKAGKLQLTVGENLGFAKSFSWLINNAPECEYYACCDQDDVWLPKKLINGVNEIKNRNSLIPVLYYTTLTVVDKNLKPIVHSNKNSKEVHRDNIFVENLLFNMLCAGCTMIFNNSLRELYRTIPVNKISSHDYTLNNIASGLGEVIFSEDSQILYRQHGNNAVGFYNASIKNFMNSFKSFFTKELKSTRFQEANIFKAYFYEKLSDENKMFIDLLSKYKLNKNYKKKLKKFIKQNVQNKFVKSYTINLLRLKKL